MFSVNFRYSLLIAQADFRVCPPRTNYENRVITGVLLNEALLGVVQWHNRELVEDLKNLLDISSQPEGLSKTLVENFLSSKPFPPVQVATPPESDRYLVRLTDYYAGASHMAGTFRSRV